MKTTTKVLVTKLIVAKPYTYLDMDNTKVTLKVGRVLETIRHRKNHYYASDHTITMGHGVGETVPADFLKVKWFVETKTVMVNRKEIKVR